MLQKYHDVMTVTATDPDIGDILTFSISGGTDAANLHRREYRRIKFITALTMKFQRWRLEQHLYA